MGLRTNLTCYFSREPFVDSVGCTTGGWGFTRSVSLKISEILYFLRDVDRTLSGIVSMGIYYVSLVASIEGQLDRIPVVIFSGPMHKYRVLAWFIINR